MAISRTKATHRDELQRIPGVGPSIANDLRAVGVKAIADLKGRSPQKLYERSNQLRGLTQDRCLLYVFRCAVYFADTPKPNPQLLDWWAWKDRQINE